MILPKKIGITVALTAYATIQTVLPTLAQDAQPRSEINERTLAYSPGEGISFSEQQLVTAEFELAFDSKYMLYGVVDGKDPVVTPSAQVTFFDWLYFGSAAIFDVTRGNGKRGSYGKRGGKYSTLDSIVGLAHDFELNETFGSLNVDVNYIYEYFHRYRSDGAECVDDTQYVDLSLSLGDLWLEPSLSIERELMLDNGTYATFEVGHKFPLIGDGDKPVLSFRPSVAQSLGNTQRVRSYMNTHPGSDVPLDHGGLMDTVFKGELEWAVSDYVSLKAYVAYYDFLLDANMRDGARSHNATWGKGSHYNRSWNVVSGLALSVTF